MVLEQMMCEKLNNEVKSLKSENSSLKETIKDKDLMINELQKEIEYREKKYKIKNALSQIKEEFIQEDWDGNEFLDIGEIYEFLYAFVEKYEAM